MRFMETKSNKVVAPEFGGEGRFNLELTGAGQARVARQDELEVLKAILLEERLENAWGEETEALRRAANDAAALAWLTPFPTLVFPELFEERAARAIAVADRQAEVRKTSRELLAV
jgi:hypothetical protein